MKQRIGTIVRNPYFIITAVYFLAHFFMLILSGCWWDDWTFMTHNLNYINEVASQSGRPEWNLLVPFCWSIPNNGRPLIFLLYLLDSIFVYQTLKYSQLFDEKGSLIIALLFTVFPVNDARILISNFAYTVGLFFFYLAFMCFVRWNTMENSMSKNFRRVLILILFYIGFILNSVLAYYYIVIAYLFVLELRRSEEKNIFKKVLLAVKDVLIRYPDFFVIPFVYYGLNKVLFPTYGDTFGNYNSVTISGLFKCFLYIPISIVSTFVLTVKKAVSCLNVYTGIILLVFTALFWFLYKKSDEKGTKIFESFRYLIYGLFVMVMGLLPYVMVRGRTIDLTGVKGRDAVLLPFGAAIAIYAVISLLKGRFKKVLTGILIICGIITFNSLYLEWQKDYYYQLSLENLLADDIIRENDTFFLTELNETDIEGQRYYSLNTNAYRVFGDQTRFFIPKVSNLYILEDEKYMREAIEVLDYSHMMKDYDPEDYCLDAVLDYYCNLDWKQVLELKFYEVFDQEKFWNLINSNGTLAVTTVDDDFTKLLLEKYDNGELQGDEDVLELLLDYAQ